MWKKWNWCQTHMLSKVKSSHFHCRKKLKLYYCQYTCCYCCIILLNNFHVQEKAPFVAKAEKRKTEYNKDMAAYNNKQVLLLLLLLLFFFLKKMFCFFPFQFILFHLSFLCLMICLKSEIFIRVKKAVMRKRDLTSLGLKLMMKKRRVER